MTYIWQEEAWPHFKWNSDLISQNAHNFALEASRVVGESVSLSKDLKERTLADFMISEAIKTSQIEGENFDREDVRSSNLNQMGLCAAPLTGRG